MVETAQAPLTLHMLLSFAQFEREVTAERIRDKVAASKRKGLWMGGRVPLGYEKDGRTLRINEAEAETVRTLYALYRKHETLRQVKAEADRLGLRTKRRFAADGTRTGGLNDDSASVARLLRLIQRVDISPGSVSILLDRNAFAACLSMGPERIREDALRIHAPFRLRRRGVETKLVLGNPTKSVDRTLLRNIANALSWLNRIKAGKTYEQIATEDAIPTDRVRKAIRYAFLAPDIVRAIVEGRQPVGLTSSYLLHHPLPDDWEKQRVLVKTL